MEIDVSSDRITIKKHLNDMDKLLLDFVGVLDKSAINYVLVSGYVSILFGRSRSSEDIDMIVENLSYDRFVKFWRAASRGFVCIQTDNPKIAFEKYLDQHTSIRFSRSNEFLPNLEFMFPKSQELDKWVLTNGRTVVLNGNVLRISPLELQIPYKLFLGSPKDIEDARFLYKAFKDNLDGDLLSQFLTKLDKRDAFNRYLA